MRNLRQKLVSVILCCNEPYSPQMLVTTLLNVMSMYHDTLLARYIKGNASYRPIIPSSLHTRFTRAWMDKDKLYKWAARALEIIRFTELVVEMAMRRKVSEKFRWRSIILLEVIKSANFLFGQALCADHPF